MTDLDFVNSALALVGEDRIASLDNTVNSTTIDNANFFLPIVKKAVLRAHDWNCARKRASLVPVTNDSLGEWTYAYRLPSDTLAVRRFVDPDPQCQNSPYAIEIDHEDKPILYTNGISAKIVYTKDFPDVNRWDALLFDAGRYRLAVDFATVLKREQKFIQTIWAVYQSKLEEAAGVDEAEGGIERVYSQSLTDVR